MARDSYSYLHFPMVAGIVLVASASKKTLATWTSRCSSCRRWRCSAAPRCTCSRTSRSGWRNVHRFSTQRLIAAGRAASRSSRSRCEIPALATLALLAAVLVVLIVDERRRFAELRERLRRQLAEA